MGLQMVENVSVKNTDDSTTANGEYEAPALTVHGSVADMTGAALPGVTHDHYLPAGAVGVNLTISL